MGSPTVTAASLPYLAEPVPETSREEPLAVSATGVPILPDGLHITDVCVLGGVLPVGHLPDTSAEVDVKVPRSATASSGHHQGGRVAPEQRVLCILPAEASGSQSAGSCRPASRRFHRR